MYPLLTITCAVTCWKHPSPHFDRHVEKEPMLTKNGAYGYNHHRIDHQLQKEEKDIVKPTSYGYNQCMSDTPTNIYTLIYYYYYSPIVVPKICSKINRVTATLDDPVTAKMQIRQIQMSVVQMTLRLLVESRKRGCCCRASTPPPCSKSSCMIIR